jgi:hypothetical protein
MYDDISPAGTLSGRRKHLELPGLALKRFDLDRPRTLMASIAIIVAISDKAGTMRIGIARSGTTSNAAPRTWLMPARGLLWV